MEIKSKIQQTVAEYLKAQMDIDSSELASEIANAFITGDAHTLERYLEHGHLLKLSESIEALLDDERERDPSNSQTKNDKTEIKGEIDIFVYACMQMNNERYGYPVGSSLEENANETTISQYCKEIPLYPACGLPNSTVNNSISNLYKEEPTSIRGENSMLSLFKKSIIQNDKHSEEHPIEDKIPEIISCLASNRIVLVQGDTGCGKTTKIPRLLLSHYKKIVCSQPRRIAAISIAKKVASDMHCKVGGLVGYSVRFEDKTSKETRLRYVTDGILLSQMSATSNLRRDKDPSQPEDAQGKYSFSTYDLIIIDEAHERSLNIDFILGCLKNNFNTKVLVMSATLNTERFLEYFKCPLITISHRIFPIDTFYLASPASDVLKTAVKTALRIFLEYEEGDILVFMTGQEDIEEGQRILEKKLLDTQAVVLKLYSAMPVEEQEKIFVRGKRKIILSTKIAEASVTIPDVKFVVDSGKTKEMFYRHEAGSSILETITISKAQAKQRAGRAGRTAPGTVFRIYTHDEYVAMVENPVPEILRSNLESTILMLKALKINDIFNFDYIDRPSSEALMCSIRSLYLIKAIDIEGNITALGEILASAPLGPKLSKILYASTKNGSLDPVTTIIAFFEARPFMEEKPIQADPKKEFSDKRGDLYMYLRIFEAWKKSKYSLSFLKKYSLKRRSFMNILKVKYQLMSKAYPKDDKIMKNYTDKHHTSFDTLDDSKIQEAFCAGFFTNIAKQSEKGYKTVFGGYFCKIHPSDSLHSQWPKYVLFYEFICTRKDYIKGCLEIDPKILSEATNKIY
ncbi:ATP-dependent RNA helicase DHX8/PRP22 [Enteropsectra breve]|nr:ATP-dependent RNA helicase DHX8/PRP22 [Enteropsectra breve]